MRRAAEENDPEEYSRQDCLFHLSILMATGNEAIIQIANIFKDRYYNYFLELNKFLFEENDGNVKALFDPKNATDAHTLIYEYLCKGNSECAQVVMNRIFSNNKQRFQCYLRENRHKERKQMKDKLHVYVGTYSQPILFGTGELFKGKGKGIHQYDLDMETGELEESAPPTEAVNPSYLVQSHDRNFYMP